MLLARTPITPDPVIPAKAGNQHHETTRRLHPRQQANGTLYIGVTSDLIKRVWQHKHDLVEGFTSKYQIHRLVYYEQHGDMERAINREKQLKKWNRAWKLRLIEQKNPDWGDLYESILQ